MNNQFIVPQFIDVEPKILGPITIRQFVLIVIGMIILFLSFRYGDIGFFLLMVMLVGPAVLLFGFLKVNGAPFHYFLLNLTNSYSKPRLRVWNKNLLDIETKELKTTKTAKNIPIKAPLSRSRLAELSLVVDTHGKYKGEEM